MLKPTNLLRRQIINKMIYWTPKRGWTGEYMEDANILLNESQYLTPYINVLFHRMQNKVIMRQRDRVWEDCLPIALHILSTNMREWLLSSSYLKQPAQMAYYDNEGNLAMNSKIRLGYLASGSPKVTQHFDIGHLANSYPYWLGKNLKQPRVADLFSFVTHWANPYYTVSLRGSKKEERYAFISTT